MKTIEYSSKTPARRQITSDEFQQNKATYKNSLRDGRNFLFEGLLFEPRTVGRTWREGTCVVAMLSGRPTVLAFFSDLEMARTGLNFLRFRLRRRRRWL